MAEAEENRVIVENRAKGHSKVYSFPSHFSEKLLSDLYPVRQLGEGKVKEMRLDLKVFSPRKPLLSFCEFLCTIIDIPQFAVGRVGMWWALTYIVDVF